MATILVVDDDPEIVDLVTSMVKSRHEATGVTEAQAALELLKTRPFDLLITDIRMPGMNGFILIDQAKKLLPDLKVVIISAYYDENDPIAQQVIQRYAQVAISKPLQVQQVNEVIDRALYHA